MNSLVSEIISILEVKIKPPPSDQQIWHSEILGQLQDCSRILIKLTSLERYVNVWALTHEFQKMELIDGADGITDYEFGRFELRILSGEEWHQQWVRDVQVITLD